MRFSGHTSTQPLQATQIDVSNTVLTLQRRQREAWRCASAAGKDSSMMSAKPSALLPPAPADWRAASVPSPRPWCNWREATGCARRCRCGCRARKSCIERAAICADAMASINSRGPWAMSPQAKTSGAVVWYVSRLTLMSPRSLSTPSSGFRNDRSDDWPMAKIKVSAVNIFHVRSHRVRD